MALATIWMILSGVLGAFSNLCMKKSLEKQGSTLFFFVLQLLFTFFVVCYLHPVRTQEYSLNLYTIVMASMLGLFLGVLKLFLRYALTSGPSSLTFASLNSASVAPSLILALIIGNQLIMTYTMYHVLGSVLVVMGLLWAISHQLGELRSWLGFAFAIFLLQTLFLCLTQCHALILENPHWLASIWSYGSEKLHSEWFVPIIFATACLVQLVCYISFTQEPPRLNELVWGIGGGLLNGACAYFFMLGPEIALAHERAFLFPFFSVSLIMTCNLWARLLYRETVHWPAMCICVLGVVIGSLNQNSINL